MGGDGTIAGDVRAQEAGAARSGAGSVYTCPECGAVLWQLAEAGAAYFQCLAGHTYGPRLLLEQKGRALEGLLWAAARTLTEKAALARQLMNDPHLGGLSPAEDGAARARIEATARQDEADRATLEALLRRYPGPSSQAAVVEEALDESASDPDAPSFPR